jgi:integrase
VRTAKPGRYGDGNGLYLLVRNPEARFWVFRYTMPGRKLREMGLGRADADGSKGGITLANARDRAAELRRLVKAGSDPLDHRDAKEAADVAQAKAAAARARTFAQVAEEYQKAHAAGWRNEKHRAQWAMTLREYAGPYLGTMQVAAVETVHVTAALRPLWHEKPETATRLRGRIEAVLDFATVHGWREGANPARWRGHLDKLFPRRSKVRPVAHHTALPWPDLPTFMRALRSRDGMSARALEFCILTAARSGEVLGAHWSEIDLDGAIWTVPRERMKARREHRVPLSPAATALLRTAFVLSDGHATLVFPGQRGSSPLSTMAMAMVLRRMRRGELTVHGFRSTFRDWAGETSVHAREVVERALAHRLGDKVEESYARGDLFQKRRHLMSDWAQFCAGSIADTAITPTVKDPDNASG